MGHQRKSFRVKVKYAPPCILASSLALLAYPHSIRASTAVYYCEQVHTTTTTRTYGDHNQHFFGTVVFLTQGVNKKTMKMVNLSNRNPLTLPLSDKGYTSAVWAVHPAPPKSFNKCYYTRDHVNVKKPNVTNVTRPIVTAVPPRRQVTQPYVLYNNIINIIAEPSEPQQEAKTNTLNNSRASELERAKQHKLLGLITTNLIKSELTKCCGALPIEQSTGKLISHLLTPEQIGVLERHRALMREAIRQYRQSKDGNKQSNVSVE